MSISVTVFVRDMESSCEAFVKLTISLSGNSDFKNFPKPVGMVFTNSVQRSPCVVRPMYDAPQKINQ